MNQTNQRLDSKGNILMRFGDTLASLSMKYMPEPSTFAVLFTIIAFLGGLFLAKQGPLDMVGYWYQGFWSLLSFSMQISLGVITGSAIANAPGVKVWIRKVCGLPKNGPQGAVVAALFGILGHYIHWGLGIVVGAVASLEIARALRRKGVKFDYPLIVAAGFTGEMCWHGGLSASVGLTIAQPGHFLESEMGVIPFTDYLLNPMNIILLIAFAVIPPIICYFLHPKPENCAELRPETIAVLDAPDLHTAKIDLTGASIGERISHSRFLGYLLALLGFTYIVYNFATKGFNLDMDLVNAIFQFVGIALYGDLTQYVAAVKNSIGGITGIVFQFPLYGGVLGMVRYSGLVDIVAGGLASISTPFTFPLITFLTAAFINMFVPSGGGQWAVQGPIAIASAKAMGADLLKLPVCGVWQHLDQSGPALLGNRHTGHLRSKGKGYYGLYDCNYAVEWPNLYAWRHIPTGIE